MIELSTKIQYLKGVGEARAKILAKRGIVSVEDLLRNYPRAYEDWDNVVLLSEAPLNEPVCIKAYVADKVTEVRIPGNRTLTKTFIADESGFMPITFFNSKFIKKMLEQDKEYLFFGKITVDKYKSRTMLSPRFEKVEGKQRIRPVYPATQTLSSKYIERFCETALRELDGKIEEILPAYLVEKYRLTDFGAALRAVHFPESEEELALAKRRLIFEELLLLQLGLLSEKAVGESSRATALKKDFSEEFFSRLSFEPTNAQRRAVGECVGDMKKEKPMNRLLQGDVGSGKTAVAAALIYSAAKNGLQSALMAPTEVLAVQHFNTLTAFFGESVSIALLTGSTTAKNKRIIKEHIAAGDVDLVIGTHAIIQNDVEYKELGLVITDEQHRFGVAQRSALTKKGKNPHTLVMSATPIPRTLAMMIYGDLDISVLDELPKGRLPVRTYKVTSDYHDRIYKFLKKTMDEGRQAYIVCPLVEESDTSGDLVPATEYYDRLKEEYFPDHTLGLLHGQMKPKEKDAVMNRFYSGEIQLLISTVVIEVGVDVPNSTVMVIENAERFGLSQLHQLRGRIGRGGGESHCILVSDAQNEEAVTRFETICSTTDGFVIAKKDLELRGPGDFFGSRQHGLPDMHVANLMTDTRILYEAQRSAKEIIDGTVAVTEKERANLDREVARMFDMGI